MITGKQRSFLKKKAHDIDAILQIGKNGLSDNLIEQVVEALEARELIKLSILNNSFLDAKEVANELANKTNSEFVQSIGNKIILYRESEENKKINLPK